MKTAYLTFILAASIPFLATVNAEDFSLKSDKDFFGMKSQVQEMDNATKDAYLAKHQKRMRNVDQSGKQLRFSDKGASGKKNMQKMGRPAKGKGNDTGSGSKISYGQGNDSGSGSKISYGQGNDTGSGNQYSLGQGNTTGSGGKISYGQGNDTGSGNQYSPGQGNDIGSELKKLDVNK